MPHCVLDVFNYWVEQQPDAIAVVHGEGEFSYQQLDKDSERIAVYLRNNGVGRNCVAAIYLDRSYELVAAVLGVLKAGACYLPLDPSYPDERLRYMLKDAQASILLSMASTSLDCLQWSGTTLCVDAFDDGRRDDENMSLAIAADDLAYLIYTSGSTGQPKGVAMEHGPLRHLIQWQLSASQQGQGHRTLQFSPLSFDVSFQEVFSTLCSGGTLVTISNEQRLDGSSLLKVIEGAGINRLFLPFVALQMLAESANHRQCFPACLQEVITAGEALQINQSLRHFFQRMPQCCLQNQYGPSESHVVSAYSLEAPAAEWPALPAIGNPLPHAQFTLWDEAGNEVEEGEVGEIIISGPCLARGYLHQPERTAERFVEKDGKRYYKTGDLGREDDSGFHYLGRTDNQVKVRGHRVELSEIEVALGEHPQVEQAVVILRPNSAGHQRLVAYYRGAVLAVGELQEFLLGTLPDYMVPAIFIQLEKFPLTASGKVDRRNLPEPTAKRPELSSDYRAAQTDLQSHMVALWEELLEVAPIGIDDNFFELGGSSLLALRFVDVLEARCQLRLSPVDLFSQPTIAGLASRQKNAVALVIPDRQLRTRPAPAKLKASRSIAIIGMAARFPGAETVEQYWRNLLEGRESIRFFTAEELGSAYSDDPNFVAAKGLIARPARFDAHFFSINPREAEIIDPQQRILLELAWQALESAGYGKLLPHQRVGVFAGTANNSYYANNIAGRRDVVDRMGAFNVMTGNEKDYVATRIAHKLNLCGPALSIHTACSTSLVAIHQAVQALRAGECHMALAGGASVSAPQQEGYLYQEGGMLSGDGHCRPFDAQAVGTIFSDGAGMVLLKSLDAALEDGDHIVAVIEGSAVNNDGGNKASFSAPNPDGQSQVILMAQKDAGISAREIGYVEAHGTATPLGDPIEVNALNQAFVENGGSTDCLLGSVKSNFGHLTAAAGVAGLIKTALILERQQVPATLHFKEPNPAIDWSHNPFCVNAKTEPWPSEKRLAAVSSFGVGGSNAHIVLSQAPSDFRFGESRPWQLLMMSHGSEDGLTQHEDELCEFIQSSELPLADIAFTLNSGRRRFACNSIVLANNKQQVVEALQNRRTGNYRRLPPRNAHRELAFMFPGQGAQVVGMAQALYESEVRFQACVDDCAWIVKPLLDEDIRECLYPTLFGADPLEAEKKLSQTLYTQLSLFVVEYSLAQLWMFWGAQPRILFGHSIGEWVAACVAGSIKREDALRAVYHRARLMQAQAPGAMLSVQAAAESLQLPQGLEIAAINSARNTVVAGLQVDIEKFAIRCEEEGIATRVLKTSHAFHSQMMNEAAQEFSKTIADIHFSKPEIPFVSCVTGRAINETQWQSADYWASQIREPVQCAQAMQTLAEQGHLLALELGPGKTLSGLFAQNNANKREQCCAVSTLSPKALADEDWHSTLAALAETDAASQQIDWPSFYSDETRRRVPLPVYPFEGQDFWINPSSTSPAVEVPVTENTIPAAHPKGLPMTDHIRTAVLDKVVALIDDLSGIDLSSQPEDIHWLEAGLDSLLLTQAASTLRREFQIELSFRQLLEDVSSLTELVDYIHQQLGPEQRQQLLPIEASSAEQNVEIPLLVDKYEELVDKYEEQGDCDAGSIEALIKSQLSLMSRQLELMRNSRGSVSNNALPINALSITQEAIKQEAIKKEPVPHKPSVTNKKGFGAQTRIDTRRSEALSQTVKDNIARFMECYVAKSPASKEFTQRNRQHLADPRAVSGFTPLLKEMVYPIVVKSSDGARLWDLDGNEYIDLVNGFGSNFLGHGPDRVKQALHRQIEAGCEIGPQTPLAAEVAGLLCELTHMERAALCNTGSEAVMGAVRLARTVSGRNTIVVFEGAYHGINDEVIVRAGKNRSMPAAAGIPPESVANVVVLDYGSDEALDFIRENGHRLAAVLVEPVQSRRPEFQPGRFLTALRAATLEADIALIFDEVITGFRIRPGGAQEYFGIRADLATYGKIIGGGMPIGAIAGAAKYMDALDGGWWSYGNGSMPEVGVTYFAGTFVRHPLAMAAAKAALLYLQEQGPQLQLRVNEKTEDLCNTINQYYGLLGFPFKLNHFGSLFKVSFDESQNLGSLFFFKLRELGVHIWEGRPCFITVAHSEEDLNFLTTCFKEAADFMLQNCFVNETVEPSVSLQVPQDKELDVSLPEEEEGEQKKITSTEAQREIWLAAKMSEEANYSFNESLSLRLQGMLHVDALKSAMSTLVQRHDALRAHFSADGQSMIIEPAAEIEPTVNIAQHDCHSASKEETEQALEKFRSEAVTQEFDLTAGPLLRFQLISVSQTEHLLLLTAHHIICDGWSLYMMLGELASLYNQQLGGPGLERAPRFADYAAWEQSEDIQLKHRQSLDYWHSKLADGTPFLEWPLDKPRPPLRSYVARRVDRLAVENFIPQARQLAAQRRATLTAVLMAGFAAFSHRLTGQKEVLFGLPFAGQLAKEDLNLVGHCVNVLPFKIRVSPGDSFADLLGRVQADLREAFQYQYLTFGTLLQSLSYKRDPSRPVLLSTLFNVDLNDASPLPFRDLDVEVQSNPRQFENFDMNLNITVTDNQAVFECTYSTALWQTDTIQRRLQEFEHMLAQAFAEPEKALGQLSLLPPHAHEQIMSWSRGPAAEWQHDHLTDLIDLPRYAERKALTWGKESMSYGELEQRSNRLANYLRAKGVKEKMLVGLLMERSADMLVSLLAIWKAGAAYVPLDPAYPRERLVYMAEKAALGTLLTSSDLEDILQPASCTTICVDRDAEQIAKADRTLPACEGNGEDPAYVIFTSGSTGKPKGVEIPHKAVVNFLASMADKPGLNAEDRLLALTTLSFDIAVLELYLPLVCGVELVIVNRETSMDGFRLKEVLDAHDITIMQATPATWRVLLAADWRPPTGFKVLCGGEAFPLDLARQLLDAGADVWNMYGPSETTVWSTCQRLNSTELNRNLSIGGPIHNTQCYVLDDNLQPLPLGVPGELFIGGSGVATGYWGQPDLTAERFIDNPFGEGRLYRSGDQACWREDGSLECLGRLDAQVKLRGFRIELSEIEAVLAEHPQVLECAAAVRHYGELDQRLIAYVRLQTQAVLNATELRAHLRQSLPEYMIPQLFSELDALPLTANGKIDRQRLPDPMIVSEPASNAAPETEVEQELAAIWSQLLQREQERRDELFFDAGGHSLLALEMITEVARRYDVKITPLDILMSTLEQLAAKIEKELSAGQEPVEPIESTPLEASAPQSPRKQGIIGRLLNRQLH